MLRIRYRKCTRRCTAVPGVAIIYGSALTESFRNGEATLCCRFPMTTIRPKRKRPPTDAAFHFHMITNAIATAMTISAFAPAIAMPR
jgi:hypothetical protein